MKSQVHLERVIAASPERVYDAWLNATAMAAFLCPMPGVLVEDVLVDAKVGGEFSLTMVAGETRIPIHGTYLALSRPKHMRFSWHSARTTSESVVELTFEPSGEHTRLILDHRGFPDESARSDHEGGWQHILVCLTEACR